jgi:hypothetical protein
MNYYQVMSYCYDVFILCQESTFDYIIINYSLLEKTKFHFYLITNLVPSAFTQLNEPLISMEYGIISEMLKNE